MQRMRIAKVVSAAASIGLLLQPVTAWAAPLDNDAASVIGQNVIAGALTMKAPADMDLPDVTVLTEDQYVGYAAAGDVSGGDKGNTSAEYDELENLKVDDARGEKSPSGWSATLTASDFSDGAGSSIDLTNISMAPNDKEAFNSADVADVVLGSEEQLADTDDDGTSDAKTVATAAATKGRGRFQLDVGFRMLVPANSDAADYSSTFTFTVS